MNLESMNCDLDEIIHEAQLMKNYNNPNVLPLHTSFVTGQDLWMVMPFISRGSVLHIIKYAYPEVGSRRGGGGKVAKLGQRGLGAMRGMGANQL